MTAPSISIVIPVYYSESSLPVVVERLAAVMRTESLDFEIVFVDDGSRDGSWGVISKLAQANPKVVRGYRLMRNFGQHNALMCGLRQVRGSYVVTMDDDLQNPPEEIPKLLRHLEDQNLDLVYANYGEKKHAAWRNAGSAAINYFYRKVFGLRQNPTSFRIMRRGLVESIGYYELSYVYLDGLLAWSTQAIGAVLTEHHGRADGGSSRYNLVRLIRLSMNVFINFSTWPLRLLSMAGIAVCGLSLLFTLFVLLRWMLFDNTVPGYTSIIVAVFFFGGIQLLSVGMLGEYIGRILGNVNRKPQYVLRESV